MRKILSQFFDTRTDLASFSNTYLNNVQWQTAKTVFAITSARTHKRNPNWKNQSWNSMPGLPASLSNHLATSKFAVRNQNQRWRTALALHHCYRPADSGNRSLTSAPLKNKVRGNTREQLELTWLRLTLWHLHLGDCRMSSKLAQRKFKGNAYLPPGNSEYTYGWSPSCCKFISDLSIDD